MCHCDVVISRINEVGFGPWGTCSRSYGFRQPRVMSVCASGDPGAHRRGPSPCLGKASQKAGVAGMGLGEGG